MRSPDNVIGHGEAPLTPAQQLGRLLVRDVPYGTHSSITVIATFEDAPGVYAIHDVNFGGRSLKITDEAGAEHVRTYWAGVEERHEEFVEAARPAIRIHPSDNTFNTDHILDTLDRLLIITSVPNQSQ